MSGFTSQAAPNASPAAMNAGPPIGYCENHRPFLSNTGAVLKNSGADSGVAATRPLRRTRACHCWAISSLVNGIPEKQYHASAAAAATATNAVAIANARDDGRNNR